MKNLVIVEFPAKKEKFEELKKTLKIALVDTRNFEGCISIDTYEDISTSTIYLIENWRAETGLADVLEPLLEGGAASLKITRCGAKLDI